MTPRKLNSGLKLFLISLKIKFINAKENEKNKERKAYQKSVRIPKTTNDLIDKITDQGYRVTYDRPGDGNCEFSVFCDSLLILY